MKYIKSVVVAVAAFIVAVVVATPASAVSANFYSVTSSVNNSGALVVNWDERGLGNGDVHYTLTGDATALWGCINGGANHPKASNKETTSEPFTLETTLRSKNGRIVGTFTATAPVAPNPFCPSGQHLELISVSYTNIVLTDTTNSSSTPVPDASRTFWNV
jgi:hypothetical protein